MALLFLHLFVTLFATSEGKKQAPQVKIPIIIDADTANEVDDLFAIVRALKEPKFNLLGLTSAQFHTSPLATENTVRESQQFNEDISKLMGAHELPLPLGSNEPLKAMDIPSPSEASNFIIQQAHAATASEKLQVVILGSCTNVASAILQDPSIIPKITVSYIGFWHDIESDFFDKNEFNSGNDTLAVEVLLNAAGLDFDVMTATTCQHLVFDREEVGEQLKDSGKIGEYLLNRWDTYERWWTREDPEKKKWIMWDVAIIEALARPEMAMKQTFNTPKENTTRLIEAYTSIKVEEMIRDFWQSLE